MKSWLVENGGKEANFFSPAVFASVIATSLWKSDLIVRSQGSIVCKSLILQCIFLLSTLEKKQKHRRVSESLEIVILQVNGVAVRTSLPKMMGLR